MMEWVYPIVSYLLGLYDSNMLLLAITRPYEYDNMRHTRGNVSEGDFPQTGIFRTWFVLTLPINFIHYQLLSIPSIINPIVSIYYSTNGEGF